MAPSRPLAALAGMLLLPAATAAPAQYATPPAPPATHTCIDVQVNGQRIPDHACLSALLTPPTATGERPSAHNAAEEMARRAPTRMGVVTPEATRQRMGNSFGKSTLPQRPAANQPALPPVIRRP